jgi:hypothetical protein
VCVLGIYWELLLCVNGVTYLSKDVRGARGLAIRSTARDEGVDVGNTCNCSQDTSKQLAKGPE